ncbi:MAG: hypothetical protein JHC28_02375 [Thermoprotei archaeon]|nr:hypothetical protein [Thermoprotei archaeon]
MSQKLAKACPYYKNGFCVSPLLNSPSDYVVNPSRCLGNYTTCRYYPPDENASGSGGGGGLTKYTDKEVEKEVTYYPNVNLLDGPIESGCEFFYLVRTSKGLVARCEVQNRVITRSQAQLCSRLFEKCPFRSLFKS